MTVNVVIGTQWGDEGKGKIVDYYARDANYVVRFQGGNNAGHTIKVKDDVYKLHVIPSGVIQGKIGVIGNGVVVDPEVLIDEIKQLKNRGKTPRLLISDRANVIMPYHKILDGAEEKHLGKKKIGTTKRGIGPCYSDKIARKGIRIGDLIDKDRLEERLEEVLSFKQKIFDAYEIKEDLDKKKILRSYTEYGEKLREYVADTSVELNAAIEQGKDILFEGAQGTMLDVDFGTYPFTTSSHTVSGGCCIGLGVGPRTIDDVIGVTKAYTTRVGKGPLPTELTGDVGKHLQEKGKEFGTTTSRPRRCGWLDLVVVKHACRISGVTQLAVTKLDVLDGLSNVKICTHYEYNGEKVEQFPADLEVVKNCTPVYKEFEGWDEIAGAESYDGLPEEAQQYLDFVKEVLDVPLCLVSIGPGREETIEI